MRRRKLEEAHGQCAPEVGAGALRLAAVSTARIPYIPLSDLLRPRALFEVIEDVPRGAELIPYPDPANGCKKAPGKPGAARATLVVSTGSLLS